MPYVPYTYQTLNESRPFSTKRSRVSSLTLPHVRTRQYLKGGHDSHGDAVRPIPPRAPDPVPAGRDQFPNSLSTGRESFPTGHDAFPPGAIHSPEDAITPRAPDPVPAVGTRFILYRT